MKNKEFKNKNRNLKGYKRRGFNFYFVLTVTAVIIITLSLASVITNILSRWINSEKPFVSFLILIGIGLIIGYILALLVGIFLLKPIEKLQDNMLKVTKGDLNVKINEESYIDEIENIYHSFNIMMKEIRSNQEMQKDFVSNVSHEFKTPLSAIEGYATLLQDKNLPENEKEEYLQEILSTTILMNDLVGNILLLSKLENQAVNFEKEKFYLDEQIRKVVVMLESNWSQKNIKLDVELDRIEVINNKGLLFHVWRNLIENAIKFSPKNSQVTISLKKEKENIVFSVSDEGIGVKNKFHIFDKFYQEDSSRRQQGNGLGLALVKRIIEMINGQVFVENLEPKGCKFTIVINEKS